jgi:hypothetical protein
VIVQIPTREESEDLGVHPHRIGDINPVSAVSDSTNAQSLFKQSMPRSPSSFLSKIELI